MRKDLLQKRERKQLQQAKQKQKGKRNKDTAQKIDPKNA
jgi:hypothetical protein